MAKNGNGWIPPEVLSALTPSAEGALLRFASSADPAPVDGRGVFVNRSVRMEKIRTLGFDLDWTLADYEQDALSELAFTLALDRLVAVQGYPPAVRQAEFRPQFGRRGVIVDIEAGNVVKMDRHRYVGRAYHGRAYIPAEERSRLYRRDPLSLGSDRFYFVDTLFELPEVNLFSELIELHRHGLGRGAPEFEPRRLFGEVRTAVDAIHADGTLKQRILADLPRYLPRDTRLPLALTRMRLGGRRLVLITNSEWYYTDALCSYLFDGTLPGLTSWRDLFDLVIVESKKPVFFRKERPFITLDEAGHPGAEVPVPGWGGLYAGGCRQGLTGLLAVPGEQVLYVGDHIYGDIRSPKVSSTWRTALILRELEDELETLRQFSSQLHHAQVLRYELAELGQRMDDIRDVLALYRKLAGLGDSPNGDPSLGHLETILAELKDEHVVMRHHKNRIHERISKAINPYWGSLFKQGASKSYLGSQVDDFACLYTSRVGNFVTYGSNHYFQVLRDPMMHDGEI